MHNVRRARLIQAGTLSLVLHLLLLAAMGWITWEGITKATPYRGPLRVELPPPPVAVVPEEAESPGEVRRAVPTEKITAPAEALPPGETIAAPPGGGASAEGPSASDDFLDPYGDLFDLPGDTRPEAGRADPEVPVERSGELGSRRFSQQGGIRYDEAKTVEALREEGLPKTPAEGLPDLSALDAALAAPVERRRTGGGEPTPGSSGEAAVDIPLGGDEVNLSLIPSLAKRVGGLPSIVLDDELRRKLREEGHPVYQAEFGFTVTPEGLIKGLHLLDSSGNTSLDQALRRTLGVGWTFRPAAGAGEAEGRVKVTVKVK